MGSLVGVEQAKLHVVCVPFPAQGHIRPMLKLAKLLHAKGFYITFVNTEYNHRRLLRARGETSMNGLKHFRFEAVPDGLPPSDADVTQDIPTLGRALSKYFPETFKSLLLRLNDSSSSSPPITLIISDCFLPSTFSVARQLGDIPLVWLCTTSACGFLGYAQYKTLLNKGVVPFQESEYQTNGSLDMAVDWVPSMTGIQLKHLPSFIRTMDKDDFMFNGFIRTIDVIAESSAPIIVNSYDALEHEVLEDVAKLLSGPLYTLGPLQLQLKNVAQDYDVKSLGSNLWKEDSQCLEWLNSKGPKSVMYVSFGSITRMTNENLVEFAWGLAKSNHPFLWILRPDLITGDNAVLPPEFFTKTNDRSLITSWCDQETVLNHPSVGAFLTHSGWNSTLDTISSGVPVLCWPFFAEQLTNCWFSVEKWGIGMEIDNTVRRTEVEKQVREVMEGEKGKEMKRNAMEWKRLADEAVESSSGSSHLNLEKFITEVLLPLSYRKS